MTRFQRLVFLTVGWTNAVVAQDIVLDSFNATSATGAVRAGTSWAGNVARNPGSISVAGAAKDDSGWGATGQLINATGMNYITIVAQRDAGNLGPWLVVQLEDAQLGTHTLSVATSAFAQGMLTSVDIAIGAWPAGFDRTRISGWSIGGGTPPLGIAALRMTIDYLGLASTPSNTPPSIAAQPPDRIAGVGTGTTFPASAIGGGTLLYQWKKGGVAIPGATSGTLSLGNLQVGDSGVYRLDVTNGSGAAASREAILTVLDARPTQMLAAGSRGFVAGGTVTIANTIAYGGTATQMEWQLLLPAGWSFASDSGNAGQIRPAAGATGLVEWRWTAIPPSPVTFSYTLNVPGSHVDDQALAAVLAFGQSGVVGNILAKSDPLIVRQALDHHSADTSHDFRISLFELTRIIELYNTRNGSVRTGCYALATTTNEDGFAPDPVRASTAASVLPRHHAADSNRDGRIGLTELTRVIELYNTRTGTLRTGRYRAQAGTEDGFEVSP